MDETQIVDVWNVFKEYIDKKHIEMAAERFVDLMADFGTNDESFMSALGHDSNLDHAINYYLDLDESDIDDEWDD